MIYFHQEKEQVRSPYFLYQLFCRGQKDILTLVRECVSSLESPDINSTHNKHTNKTDLRVRAVAVDAQQSKTKKCFHNWFEPIAFIHD